MSTKVPEDYECPLCPCCSGRGELFFHSKILGAPICRACSIELDGLIEEDDRPNDPLLDRLEELTGLTFTEYKRIGYEQFVETYEGYLKSETFFKDSAETFQVTGKSPREIMAHYKYLVSYYRNELKKLERIDGEHQA